MMDTKPYLEIVAHYESCLDEHGDTPRGVDWPHAEDAAKRYQVMLDLLRPADMHRRVRLLDFGCGASHLYEYILSHRLEHIEYSGLDLSAKFVELSKSKFPNNTYYCGDLLDDPGLIPSFDFIVMNGVFTEKRSLTFDDMLVYFQRLADCVFSKATTGIAFNVMSTQVDWTREDLFHLPLDILTGYLVENLSRNFVIRNDYGLYEYTTYVYR
jgi:Methyltransferase domain